MASQGTDSQLDPDPFCDFEYREETDERKPDIFRRRLGKNIFDHDGGTQPVLVERWTSPKLRKRLFGYLFETPHDALKRLA